MLKSPAVLWGLRLKKPCCRFLARALGTRSFSNLEEVDVVKRIMTALTAVLCLGLGSAQADEIPLCEYVLGDAAWICALTFGHSPVAQSRQCGLYQGTGNARWTDYTTVDPDKLTEAGRNYFNHPNMRAAARKSCRCDISLSCMEVTADTSSSNGWFAPPKYGYQNVRCSSWSLESLRTMTKPDC